MLALRRHGVTLRCVYQALQRRATRGRSRSFSREPAMQSGHGNVPPRSLNRGGKKASETNASQASLVGTVSFHKITKSQTKMSNVRAFASQQCQSKPCTHHVLLR